MVCGLGTFTPRWSKTVLVETEVPFQVMPNKVLPFPSRRAADPSVACHSRVKVRVGRQNYAIDVTCQATPLPNAAPKHPKASLVETRFLRLRKPAEIGDRVGGWRVCWLGGWDRGKMFFIVMVDRVVGR